MGRQYPQQQKYHPRSVPKRVTQSNGKLRKNLHRFLGRPEDLDIRGLGRKVCEVLGIRSGDKIELHVLADGSVRIVNYRNA